MKKRYIFILGFIVVFIYFLLDNAGEKSSIAKSQATLFTKKITQQSVPSQNNAKRVILGEKIVANKKATIANDYIVECKLDEKQLQNNYPQDKFDSMFEKIMDELKQSANIDKQLAYALYSKEAFIENNTNNIERIKNIVLSEPTNALAMISLLQECSDTKLAICDQTIENLAIQYHGDNGYVWFLLAKKRIDENDNKGAIQAFNNLITSAYFDVQFANYIINFIKSTEGYDYLPEALKYAQGIGFAAARRLPALHNVMKFCKKESINNIELAYLCIDVGKALEERSKLALLNIAGIGLQNKMYNMLGNNEEENLLLRQKDIMTTITNPKAQALLIFDENLDRLWLDTLKTKGEVAANKAIYHEAVLLSKNKNYNPCKSIF